MSQPVPAIPSATLLLLRDEGAALRVLMTARAEAAGFAAGALVFPGGKIEREDAALLRHARGLEGLAPAEAAARIAALRETFEESGLLLARRTGTDGLLSNSDLEALTANGADFPTLATSGGLELAADLLLPFAHWITPLDRPKRFDTRFYVAAFTSDQEARHDGHEAVESRWCDPASVVREGEDGRAKLVFATRLNLLRLARAPNTAAALAEARAQPLVTVLPEFVKTEAGVRVRIPVEAGYGGPDIEPVGIVRA